MHRRSSKLARYPAKLVIRRDRFERQQSSISSFICLYELTDATEVL